MGSGRGSGMTRRAWLFALQVCLLLGPNEVLLEKGRKSTESRCNNVTKEKKTLIPGIDQKARKKSFVFPIPHYHEVEKHKRGCIWTESSCNNVTMEKKTVIPGIDQNARKKSFVFQTPNYEEVEKHKRGFLANLANLLNDAELIASRKSKTALTAFTKEDPKASKKSKGLKSSKGSEKSDSTKNHVSIESDADISKLKELPDSSKAQISIENDADISKLKVVADKAVADSAKAQVADSADISKLKVTADNTKTQVADSAKTQVSVEADADISKIKVLNSQNDTGIKLKGNHDPKSSNNPTTKPHPTKPMMQDAIPGNKKDMFNEVPPSEEISNIFNETNKFASIFAMYHGKLITLGKVPDYTFDKKLLTHRSPDLDDHRSPDSDDHRLPDLDKHDSHFKVSSKNESYTFAKPHTKTKDITGSKREEILNDPPPKPTIDKSLSSRFGAGDSQDGGLNRLADYLKSLDEGNSQDQQISEESSSSVTKDVVEFPETEETRKVALFNHVKGVLLDNGKILSVNPTTASAAMKDNVEPAPDDVPQKVANEDSSLSSMMRKKQSDGGDSTSRDVVEQAKNQQSTEMGDSQKTVTLTLDALKELLRKSEARASLESLLSKKNEKKTPPVQNAVEPDELETKKPDTYASITSLMPKKEPKLESQNENREEGETAKKTDSVSLAAILNKKPDTKSEAESPEEDPGTIEDFAAGGLKSHNEYRLKHHDDTLIWSDDIAAKAQKLAETLADKKTLEIAKDLEKEGFGENVAKVWATFKNAGEVATKMWYSQSENYHFDDPHLDENTGQFTQVIWKSTQELGMGVAKSIDDVNNKYVYVTALYRPPGNVESLLRENVLPTGNNTVDVYTTFFKRTGVTTFDEKGKH